MQIIKLVNPGVVDKLIGFDSLPEQILDGVRRAPIGGLGRHWNRWFESIGYDLKKDPKPFYFLDYKMVNKDKEKWSEINSYVKRNVRPDIRLLDKIEDMSVKVAPDCYSSINLYPEDVPVIPVLGLEERFNAHENKKIEKIKESLIEESLPKVEIKVEEPLVKKRGRKKVA